MTYPLSSSPYQRVPSTPQVNTRTNHLSSPSFRGPQLQNLYSSPVPDRIVVDVRDGFQSSPINPFQSLSQDDGSLISEGAAVGGGVEQVVPATPNRNTDYAYGSQIQVPFTIDSWTSETPQMYPFQFQNQMFSQTSSFVPSQEETSIALSRDRETPTDLRLNIRHTPSSQRRVSNASHISSPRLHPILSNNMRRRPQPAVGAQPNNSLSAPEVGSAALDVQTPTRSSRNIQRSNVRRTPRRLLNGSMINLSQSSRTEPSVQAQAQEQVPQETPRRLHVMLQRHATPLLNRVSRSTRSRTSVEMDIFCTDNIFR